MHKAFSNKKQHISFNNKKNKTIVICFEHAEYDLKQTVKKYLENKNYKTIDVGTYSKDSTHYSLYAIAMAKHVNNEFAPIALCFTGFGIANTCNKFNGIYACICRSGLMKLLLERDMEQI